MRVRKWVKRMAVVDLLAFGLLVLLRLHCGEAVMTAAAEGSAAAAADVSDAESVLMTDMSDAESAAAAGISDTERIVKEDGPHGTEQSACRRVALTFDDGPHPRYTEILLDGLRERGVRATFFVTGANAEKYPDIVKRMQEEGHLIGNHTYHHVQLTAANEKQFREEIISTNETIREITGEDTAFIRPPYGSWNKKYEEELNMFPVLWTIDPRDWCSDDTACIVNNTITRIQDNDIILMHDQYKSSVAAALEIVDALQKEGYEFVTVEEILFD